MERDLLDILVAVFTITTGVVLGMAALLAYLVQRARYLRESAPDLEVSWDYTRSTFSHSAADDLR